MLAATPSPMEQYLLLNHGVGTSDHWDEFFKMLHEGGYFVGGSSLGQGSALRKGIFADPISPTVTGYILIQTENIETARHLARLCPVHVAGGTVELIPLVRG